MRILQHIFKIFHLVKATQTGSVKKPASYDVTDTFSSVQVSAQFTMSAYEALPKAVNIRSLDCQCVVKEKSLSPLCIDCRLLLSYSYKINFSFSPKIPNPSSFSSTVRQVKMSREYSAKPVLNDSEQRK